MESFEDLGLAPELVEALASDGIEEPTPFQAAAIPVIRRANNLFGRAGPGAGTLIAYGAALLDRLKPGLDVPRALVVVPDADGARRLAESLAALATATDHVVAAAGSPWVLPERADVLFGTADQLLDWAKDSRVRLDDLEAVVVEQAGVIERTAGLAAVEALFEFVPMEAQRVVFALPITPVVEDFVERHARRAVRVPPPAVEGAAEAGPRRGEVRFRIVQDPREAGGLGLVAELLEDAKHVCLFFASEDRAADVGDFLELHGFSAGAPGDEDAPVWLAVDEMAARPALDGAQAVPVSFDCPAGPDALDRRHGGGRGGIVLVLAREVAHLRDVSRRTGYRVVPFPPPPAPRARGELDALFARLEAAGDEVDLAPWLAALEPLFARRGAPDVAAAAVALLRAGAPSGSAPRADPGRAPTEARAAAPPPRRGASAPVAFVRLFISLGERDNAGPRDLVGAITGEAGVEGSRIGRIEVRDTFSIVEVEEPIAASVIRALNGITIRGRSVRADYDRGATSGRTAAAGRKRGSDPDHAKRADRASGRPPSRTPDRPRRPRSKDAGE